jgi:2-dehydro-3-deoxygluconokinase
MINEKRETKNEKRKFDMTTFGETMVRLSVRPGYNLSNTNEIDIHTGGTESNAAVALARIGMKTAWVSRLTDNALGKRIEFDIKRHGVDTSGIVWTPEDRVGAYYVEFATPPRASTVLYDRRHSAISRLKPKDLDWNFLLNTRLLHLTGITPALSPTCKTAVMEAVRRAKARRIPISFDVNYRAKLWKPAQAAKAISPLLRDCTMIIMTSDDAATLFNLKSEPETVVKRIQYLFHCKVAVLTIGGKGALVWDGNKVLSEPGFALNEVVDRLGAGDAFAAGMIYGFLANNLELGLKYGIAMSAMKIGMRGDYWWGTKAEVDQILKGREGHVSR